MAKNVKVDPNICIGCGTCAALAGQSFKMNDSGKSEAINPPGDPEETVQQAIDSCPVNAISRQE